MNAGAVIDRMQKVLGVKTDIAVGSHFGLGTSAVSNWRARGKVPFDECVILSNRKGVSLDWLVLGLGTMDGTIPAVPPATDPRLQRLLGFFTHWAATRSADDQAWLETQLARTIPEYAEWVAARDK